MLRSVAPISKPAVKGLEIVPNETSLGPHGTFLVEGGWGCERQLSGNVRCVTRKSLKDAKLSLEFLGTQIYGRRDTRDNNPPDSRILVRYTKVLLNSSTKTTFNAESRSFVIPFSFNLPNDGLPPSFDDGRVEVVYHLQAQFVWNFVGKQQKEWTVPVIVTMPIEARLTMLKNVEPLILHNHEETSPADETSSIYSSSTRTGKIDFHYSLTINQRVIPSGGLVTCHLQLSDLPTDGMAWYRVTRVTARVQCTKEYLTSAGPKVAAREMVSVTEMVRGGGGWRGGGYGGGAQQGGDDQSSWEKTFSLALPITEPSLNTPLVNIKHSLIFLVYGDLPQPLTGIEAPITVVPGDEVYMRGRPRNGSASSTGTGIRASALTTSSSSGSTSGMASPFPYSSNNSPVSPGAAGSPRQAMEIDGATSSRNQADGYGYGQTPHSPARRPSEAYSVMQSTLDTQSILSASTSSTATPPSASILAAVGTSSPPHHNVMDPAFRLGGMATVEGVQHPTMGSSASSLSSHLSTTPRPTGPIDDSTPIQQHPSSSHPLGTWAKGTLSERSAPFEPSDKRKVYRAGVNYDPQAVDEIGLRRGDLVVVMDTFKDG
ncbi:hypothetical protein HK097_001312, partial [Rhizophlyctis rosea]